MKKAIPCLLVCLITSCHWRTKHPQDRPRLIDLVRSYEPDSFKSKVPSQFYDYRGAFDFWRFPLVYPYAIGCIDVTEYGFLYSNKKTKDYEAGGGLDQVSDYHFDKFIFDKSHFVGSKCRTPFDKDTGKLVDRYFIFSFADSTTEDVDGAARLRKKLKDIHFSGDTTFMTIDQYGYRL